MKMSDVRIDGTPESGWSIVALHGGPGLDHSYFWPYLEPLTKRNRVVSYQQGTIQGIQSPSIDSIVQELKQVVEVAAQNSKVCILGHSFGGALALEYVNRMKKKPALILSNWICDMDWLTIYQKNNPMASARASSMRAAQNGIDDPVERFRIRMLSYLDDYFTPNRRDEGRKILEKIRYAPEIGGPIEADYCPHMNLEPVLHEIDWPILSIAAENDRVVFPEYHLALAKKHKNLRHQLVKGAHFPFVEDSAGFCLAVEDYLNAIKMEGYL